VERRISASGTNVSVLSAISVLSVATNGSNMPKQKTKRAAMKRFFRTGTGKLKRGHANHTHILTKKTRKRKNRLKKLDLVSSADYPRVNRLLQA